VSATLASGEKSAHDPKVQATLGLLEKLVRQPEQVSTADVDAVRAAGVTDDAIEDAAAVCALFTTMVRLADTLDFEVQEDESFEWGARKVLKRGYSFPRALAWLARNDG
jgi:alkylhydroperoxidase family enzyme